MKVGKRGLQFDIEYDVITKFVVMRWFWQAHPYAVELGIQHYCDRRASWKLMCYVARQMKRELLKEIEKKKSNPAR